VDLLIFFRTRISINLANNRPNRYQIPTGTFMEKKLQNSEMKKDLKR
jgi:hypothetical protein